MQVSEQKLPNSRIRLTLTTEPSFNKECFEAVIGVLRKETAVDGFRKGKSVPLPLLYSAAGGEAAVKGKILEAVIEKAVSLVSAKESRCQKCTCIGADEDENVQEITWRDILVLWQNIIVLWILTQSYSHGLKASAEHVDEAYSGKHIQWLHHRFKRNIVRVRLKTLIAWTQA